MKYEQCRIFLVFHCNYYLFWLKKIYLYGYCRKEKVLILKVKMCEISAAVHLNSIATPSKPYRSTITNNMPDKHIYKPNILTRIQ